MKLIPTPVCTSRGLSTTLYARSPIGDCISERGDQFDLTGLLTPVFPDAIFNKNHDHRFIPKESFLGPLDIYGVFATGNPWLGTEVIFAAPEHSEYSSDQYAIKVRRKSSDDVENWDFEAGLNFYHPNITRIKFIGEAIDSRKFGVMDLINGISLKQAIDLIHSRVLNPERKIPRQKRKDPFEDLKRPALTLTNTEGTHTGISRYENVLRECFMPDQRILLREQLKKEILNAMLIVAMALDFLKEQNVAHCDIKPANILLSYEYGKMVPHIIDLGAASNPYVDEGALKTGRLRGTPGFVSPEIISGGDVDSRADFFSLSAIIYKIATGESPFAGPNRDQILKNTISLDPKPLSNDSMNDLVMRGLNKSPDQRLSGQGFIASFKSLLTA
jgi:serine/threonine protein kinase